MSSDSSGVDKNSNSLANLVFSKKIVVYRNDEVEGIIAGIPRGHMHLRLALILRDQVIVLHEATVAAIVRAYANTVLHPLRKATAFLKRDVGTSKKHGYASIQQIEVDIDEDDLLDIIDKIMRG